MPAVPTDVDLAIPRPAAPSPTQSHGTVLLGIVAGFVVLGVLLWLSVRGVGPFTARIVSTSGTGDQRTVVVEVANTGSRTGRGNCSIVLEQGRTPLPPQTFQSERIRGGETITQTVTFTTEPGAVPRRLRCA